MLNTSHLYLYFCFIYSTCTVHNPENWSLHLSSEFLRWHFDVNVDFLLMAMAQMFTTTTKPLAIYSMFPNSFFKPCHYSVSHSFKMTDLSFGILRHCSFLILVLNGWVLLIISLCLSGWTWKPSQNLNPVIYKYPLRWSPLEKHLTRFPKCLYGTHSKLNLSKPDKSQRAWA